MAREYTKFQKFLNDIAEFVVVVERDHLGEKDTEYLNLFCEWRDSKVREAMRLALGGEEVIYSHLNGYFVVTHFSERKIRVLTAIKGFSFKEVRKKSHLGMIDTVDLWFESSEVKTSV